MKTTGQRELTSNVESNKSVFCAIHKTLKGLFVEMFHRAWEVFPFNLVNTVVTFFPFDLRAKKSRHLLYGSMLLEFLRRFTRAENEKKTRIQEYIEDHKDHVLAKKSI